MLKVGLKIEQIYEYVLTLVCLSGELISIGFNRAEHELNLFKLRLKLNKLQKKFVLELISNI